MQRYAVPRPTAGKAVWEKVAHEGLVELFPVAAPTSAVCSAALA